MLPKLKIRSCAIGLLGSAVLAFGLYHIHAFSAVTEGGQLGLVLLLRHWFSISPALSGLIINVLCYLIGFKTLGMEFIGYSAVCGIGFSAVYWICEQFPPLWPELASYPLAASLLGALFVGVGTGLCVRIGGAPSGDDALAMSFSRITGWKIEYLYLISDFSVLALSLSYIPITRIGFSVLSVILSSCLVGLVQRMGSHQKEST